MACGGTSLGAAMRAPGLAPEVVVVDFVYEEKVKKDLPDPKTDLWVSTVDGRHQSPIIPIRVGATAELFEVHRDVLTKSAWFRRALDGQFREAGSQSVDLPEENPTIFSFVVAFLYEEKFVPIKPVACVLVQALDKGKGRENEVNSGSGDEGTESGTGLSDDSNNSHRARQTRRRRAEREWTQRQRKEPGRHRPDCQCNTCAGIEINTTCWNCGIHARRPPARHYPQPQQPNYRGGPPRPGQGRDRARPATQYGAMPLAPIVLEERMSEEDLRTWSQAYSLSVDVFVAADRYLMKDFKECISSHIINQFEIAGLDAANPTVLNSCRILYDGVSTHDPLVKKIFARVGFLQARLWKMFPEETSQFFMENPEVTMLIMKEMVERREVDLKGDLPAMERSPLLPLLGPPGYVQPRQDYVNRRAFNNYAED